MVPDDILSYCLSHLQETVLIESWGERGVFYNPGHRFKRGIYVLTVKEKDGPNDRASRLDRPGVFRVNLGVGKDTFRRLFGLQPARPPRGGVIGMDVDFSAQDVLLPHPVYGWMSWLCVLNPSPDMFETLKPLIEEAYRLAREKSDRRR